MLSNKLVKFNTQNLKHCTFFTNRAFFKYESIFFYSKGFVKFCILGNFHMFLMLELEIYHKVYYCKIVSRNNRYAISTQLKIRYEFSFYVTIQNAHERKKHFLGDKELCSKIHFKLFTSLHKNIFNYCHNFENISRKYGNFLNEN